jgi:hypothetical protein
LKAKNLTARQRKLLRAFEKYGTITSACKDVGVARSTWHEWRTKIPAFAAAVEESNRVVADDLERECFRRAIAGSDLLLMFVLNAMRPEKYRERRYSKVKHVLGRTSAEALARAITASPTTNTGS